LINEKRETFLAPPISLDKWEKALGGEYVLLIRAHYAVSAALNIQESAFVRDVSDYPQLNDLYAIADVMISDYSSAFFDFAILDRPMLCFAYDLEEYEEKRGLYLDLAETLPCPIDRDEDMLIDHILHMDRQDYIERTKVFHRRFAPYAGHASAAVVNEIEKRLAM
jgi:CDP-glycerol glycerophosphotransferase